jgi:hypothetical protein
MKKARGDRYVGHRQDRPAPADSAIATVVLIRRPHELSRAFATLVWRLRNMSGLSVPASRYMLGAKPERAGGNRERNGFFGR